MHATTPVLNVRGLCVAPAATGGAHLHPTDVQLERGEILSLLGIDTGGQSLLIDALLGLHRRAEGEVRILGLPPRDPRALDRIGVVRRRIGFPTALTVREVIRLVQSHYHRTTPADELLERFSMAGAAGRRTGDLNREDRRWLALVLAFAGDPELVMLDHPTVGMDEVWRAQFWDEMRRFGARGGAVLVATHLIEDAGRVSDRVLVFRGGRAIAAGAPWEIVRHARPELPSRNVSGDPEFVRRGDFYGAVRRLSDEADGAG
jgi:ABC-2 type transport system ATP-binding protein